MHLPSPLPALAVALALLGIIHCGGKTGDVAVSDGGDLDAASNQPNVTSHDASHLPDRDGLPDAGDTEAEGVDAARDDGGRVDAGHGDGCAPFSGAGNHRAQAVACAKTPPPDAGNTDGGNPDQCLVDGECSDGGVCSCQGNTFGWAHQSSGNVCVAANCHVDSDCGPGGICSPTVDPGCGPFYGVQGYYCRTCADTCVNDGDCASEAGPNGYCAYDAALGHWACEYGRCAG